MFRKLIKRFKNALHKIRRSLSPMWSSQLYYPLSYGAGFPYIPMPYLPQNPRPKIRRIKHRNVVKKHATHRLAS